MPGRSAVDRRVKAVILVGGLGSRLRALAEDLPKPMLPFFDRPMLSWVADPLLNSPLVERVTLATGFAHDAFTAWTRTHPKLRQTVEPEPLGTAGALAWALADEGGSSPLWVQNGDALLWPDVAGLLAAHTAAGAECTMGVLWHQEPQHYGRIVTEDSGRVTEFREKDSRDSEPGWINAGVYLLEKGLWEQLEVRPSSLERDWMTRWLSEGTPIQAVALPGYFCDLGTPERYRQAHFDVLEGRTPVEPGPGAGLPPGVRSSGPVWLGQDVELGPQCELRGPLVLGAGCRVGPEALLEGCVLGPRVQVGAGARLEDCVLGSEARVPERAHLRSFVGGRVRESA